MENSLAYLSIQFGGNTILQYISAAAMFCIVYGALRLIRNVVIAKLLLLSKMTKTSIDDRLLGYVGGVQRYIYFLISFFVALQWVTIPDSVSLVINVVFFVAIVSLAIGITEQVIAVIVDAKTKKEDGTGGLSAVYRIAIRFVLWALGLLLILSNLGINVNSLIAGLGIGGLAVSLALQNILGDLFSSFSLAVDKPFEEGDFIVVGPHKGTVKQIGLKTTRIEALEGEEIIISNSELTTARVQNYKRMRKRRVVFTFGCTYDTAPDQVRKIPGDITKIINDHKHAEAERVHFREFGESELRFEAVYYVLTSDYMLYMDAQQDINIRIMQYFAENGLEFAYPTRTVYMKGEK